ncbi:hypothetical protein DL93DRAFT_1162701 [Clavulina sp. PMI_390]|nr:hypothetical protein DL93DRAFT_1162701 [Clavulina sp. PMI_390]
MVYLTLGFGNVEVWVQSDRRRLPEFGLREPPRAASWIPSTDNSAFSVHYTTMIPLTEPALLLIYVNADLITSHFLRAGEASDTWSTSLRDEDDEASPKLIFNPYSPKGGQFTTIYITTALEIH